MRGLLLLPLIAGCGGDHLLFLARPWEADRTVVLVATDVEGNVLRTPSISTGSTLELAIEEEPPFSLLAWVFAPEVLAPSCSIGIGGEGFPIPEASEVWRAEIEDLEEPAVFALADPPPLDLETSCGVPLPCPQLQTERIALDELAGNDVGAIVALSPTRALIAGNINNVILQIDGDRRRRLDTSSVVGTMRSLARDGDTIYGATTSHVFRFTLADEIFETRTSTIQRGLELVPGGPPIVYGTFGIREVFTEAASATTAVERMNGKVKHVRVVAPDRGLLIDDANAIHSFDGGGWKIDSPESGGFTVESFRRLDGDEVSFMVVGRRENAFLLKDGVWEQLPLPFNRGIAFNDVVSLGEDRFLAVGEFGAAALRSDGHWCTYELTPDVAITRVVRTDDPRIFLAGTTLDTGSVPYLLRITMME